MTALFVLKNPACFCKPHPTLSMKAILIHSYGQKDVLQYDENVPKPSPGKNEILVRVMAASVNPVDWKIRNGNLALVSGKKFPKILGLDFAGWIEATGDKITRFQKRDKVFGHLTDFDGKQGGYAEYLTISEKNITTKPDGITYPEAACLPVAGLTALQGFVNCNLKAGQRVLINGASGGVGTFAVQLAHILKAHVTAVCSAKNANLVASLGADRLVDYQRIDFTKETEQYDIVFDALGNQSLENCKSILTPKGIYFTTSPNAVNLKDVVLTSVQNQKVKIGSVKANPLDLDYLAGLVNDKSLRVVIDEQYDLKDLPAAFAYSEGGHVAGKLVINIK